MHPFPHVYRVMAKTHTEGDVQLSSSQIADLQSAAPKEFGGPGDRWSPETLLTAAVADCLVLSFKAVATASKFTWTALECEASGTVERVDNHNLFTGFTIKARLTVPADADAARARKLLEKAEQVCLISNSLKAKTHLETEVINQAISD